MDCREIYNLWKKIEINAQLAQVTHLDFIMADQIQDIRYALTDIENEMRAITNQKATT